MRLQAFLARAGAAPSRRKAEAMISSGRVLVNGVPAELGSRVEPEDEVVLEGRRVSLPDTFSYLALNKPAGYLTTMKDDFGRRTVRDLMPDGPDEISGLVPVGRLDVATTGLILLTNDGNFANLVAHPSSEIEKEYELTIRTPIPKDALEKLAAGPVLDDGPMLPPILSTPQKKGSHLRLNATIHEGRNRIIRRACEAAGLDLVSLSRIRVGQIRLSGLKPGQIRTLTASEVASFTGKPSGKGSR